MPRGVEQKKRQGHLAPEADVLDLDRFNSADQRLRDKIHERLLNRSEADPLTGCQIFTGCWDATGRGKVRVGGQVYPLDRVSAWLYIPGFQLWDGRFLSRVCDSPACINPQHLLVVESRQECLALQRARGRLHPDTWHHLSWAKADHARQLAIAGWSVHDLADLFQVGATAIRNVLRGRTWRRKPNDHPQ
jgi:hypothetical protein